ncbi:hypothetical protein IH601_05305 [Candidatus Bipolaricaulota bacterium]|jgi:hypothetical protein|nr:hypothetical protein [Candidatus Bipolaricaulota bacterium]TFH10358.1 MAG: hypothetical protein E4H08_03805 [Candidatus Atribacteria bacterium]
MIGRLRFLIGILITVSCWISLPTWGQAPCEFMMPVSTIESAQFSFAYWHHDDGTTPGIDASAGQLAAKLDRIYDSPLFGYTMSFSTAIELDTLLAQSWVGSGSMSYRYYISEELPIFVYAGTRLDAATYQVQPGCELRSGIGIGRLRDVTPLAKTQRIITLLQDERAITRSPSSQAILEIAETVARVESYEQFEEYVADVATAIESKVGATLDPASVLTVRAELERGDDKRYCGAILQGGVGYELIDPYDGLQDVLYVMSGDVAHSPTANSQLRCRMSWSGAGSDFLGENTSALDFTYTADLRDSNAVTASYGVKRVASAALAARTTQTATVEYALAMGRTDLLFSLALSKKTGDQDWTIDVSVSFALDLL